MTETHMDVLWRSFPKTLLEFEERFATEEACREYRKHPAKAADASVSVQAAFQFHGSSSSIRLAG